MRLTWPLPGDLAGSPGLDLQTNLHFLPEQDFLVARNLAPFTEDRKRVPREQCLASGLFQEVAGMLACGAQRQALRSVHFMDSFTLNSFVRPENVHSPPARCQVLYQALGTPW